MRNDIVNYLLFNYFQRQTLILKDLLTLFLIIVVNYNLFHKFYSSYYSYATFLKFVLLLILLLIIYKYFLFHSIKEANIRNNMIGH